VKKIQFMRDHDQKEQADEEMKCIKDNIQKERADEETKFINDRGKGSRNEPISEPPYGLMCYSCAPCPGVRIVKSAEDGPKVCTYSVA